MNAVWEEGACKRAVSTCALLEQTATAVVGPAEAESSLVRRQRQDVAATLCTPRCVHRSSRIGIAAAALARPAQSAHACGQRRQQQGLGCTTRAERRRVRCSRSAHCCLTEERTEVTQQARRRPICLCTNGALSARLHPLSRCDRHGRILGLLSRHYAPSAGHSRTFWGAPPPVDAVARVPPRTLRKHHCNGCLQSTAKHLQWYRSYSAPGGLCLVPGQKCRQRVPG